MGGWGAHGVPGGGEVVACINESEPPQHSNSRARTRQTNASSERAGFVNQIEKRKSVYRQFTQKVLEERGDRDGGVWVGSAGVRVRDSRHERSGWEVARPVPSEYVHGLCLYFDWISQL